MIWEIIWYRKLSAYDECLMLNTKFSINANLICHNEYNEMCLSEYTKMYMRQFHS